MTTLFIHADRKLPALVDGGSLPWIASPEAGVERRMLERSGGEIAIATSIVRYQPGSRFSRHSHARGEEFYVLNGIFSDEHGDYPAGSYVRNPSGSAHAPFSENGCVIFVKLRQMADDENEVVRAFPEHRVWRSTDIPGHEIVTLYESKHGSVTLDRLPPGTVLPAREIAGGEEILVIEGSVHALDERKQALGVWTWSRRAGSLQPALRADAGALLWIKRGHLK